MGTASASSTPSQAPSEQTALFYIAPSNVMKARCRQDIHEMTYQHKQLSDPKAEIRVAVLQPGAHDDDIHVSFRLRQLQTETPSSLTSNVFEYEALSYVWGPQDDPSYVRVITDETDEGDVSVTRNLATALRHLRYMDRSRLIWIDALCINQSNLAEKGTQVAEMGTIFATASCVIAWLGPEGDTSNDAFNVIRLLAYHVEVDWPARMLRPSYRSSEPVWADEKATLPFRARELDSVCTLLERPYFERTWIKQEILLATRTVIQCGQQQIPWEDFERALACIMWKTYYDSAIEKDRKENFRKVLHTAWDTCHMYPGAFHYSSIRTYMRDTVCLDQRDRLYAVLNLLSPDDRRLGIETDYTGTVEELYADVARRMLTINRKLVLLETCELSARALDIPSWVPDWSSRIASSELVSSQWSACGWISAQANFTGTRKLCVAGTIASRVEKITELDVQGYGWSNEDGRRMLRELRPSIQALAAQSGSFSKSVELYCRALAGNQFSGTFGPENKTLPRCTPDFDESRKALELVWSSDTNADSADAIPEDYLSICGTLLVGRCCFLTSNGYIGLAPTGTLPGDIVCVLLGCRFPVILRPVPKSKSGLAWQVVGVCEVQGLMHSEAIYGDKLPSDSQFFAHTCPPCDRIDGFNYTLYDPETQTFKRDPAEILTEIGIKVERYQRDPHILEVLPETLRAAGVALQDFTLV